MGPKFSKTVKLLQEEDWGKIPSSVLLPQYTQ
jgi:hypothetical protein